MLSGLDLLQEVKPKVGDIGYSFKSYKAAEPYLGLIGETEKKYGLPKNLLANVIDTESRYKPDAKSPAGAIGIAQIVPKWHPNVDPTNPVASIDYAGGYLKKLHDQFGSWDEAIAAYNTGPGNLRKFGMGNLPSETKNYLKRINAAKIKVTKAKPDIVIPQAKTDLDLLKKTTPSGPGQVTKTDLDLLQGIAPIEEKTQVKTGLALLEQQVVTKAPTTEIPAVKAPISTTRVPTIAFDPLIAPEIVSSYAGKFSKGTSKEFEAGLHQMGPLITAENTAPAMDTLGRLWNLAQHPYDVVKGSVVFASAIPGFIGGLASAIGQVPIEILKGGTVLDWYNASTKNMQVISGMWYQGVSAPLGKLMETPEKMGEELALTMFGAEPEVHKDETELVGEIFMVPYTAAATPLHEFADSPTWNNHPNVRGLLKFSADALGLVTMGLIFKGGPVMAARKVDHIVKRAHDIDVKENAINVSGLDEVLKVAQKKVLDAEKRQLELEIESLKKELDHEKLAKENLKEKGKEVEGIKEGTEFEVVREERLRFAEEAAKKLPKEKPKTGIRLIKKEPPKPTKKVVDIKGKLEERPFKKGDTVMVQPIFIEGKEFWGVSERTLDIVDYVTKDIPIGKKTKEGIEKYDNAARKRIADDIKDTYGKEAVSDYNSAVLSMTKEAGGAEYVFGVEYIIDKYGDKFISEEVKGKVIDVDFQTGLKEPVELSTESSPFRETPERTQAMKDVYAERAEAVRSNPELMTNKLLNDVNRWLDGEDIPVEKAKNDLSELAARAEELERSFISRTDFLRWKDTVSDAASWARKADRLKIEPTKVSPREYQERFPEKTVHEDWDMANRPRFVFEGAGDILRELQKDYADPGYIKEKLNRVNKFIEGELSGKISEEDSLSTARKYVPEKLDRLTKQYKEQPVETNAESIAKDAITSLLEGDFEKARGLYSEISKNLDTWKDKKVRSKIERPKGPTLYTGLPLDEAVKQLKSMTRHTAEFMKEFKDSFKEKEFDFAHAVKQVKADTLRSLWDQSETLLNIVKNKYPAEYDRVVSRQRSAVTGIGYGKVLYGQAVKEIYGGKSKEMIEAVNAYVLARRFKDIYGYRAEKGYKHQPGYGSEQTISTTAMIEMIKDIPPDAWKDLASKVPELEVLFGRLTPEEMAEVVKAGNAYFEWSRKIVDDLVGAGIKSPEEGVLLKSHDFRKFKTMLVKKLYDFNYDLQLKGETIKVSNSGVLELGSGSSKIIEPDSRIVLSEQMARAYGSIAHQAAALEWKGIADRHPDNGFVSMKRQASWSPIPYMADGVRKNIYFHPDAVKYLVTRSRDLSPRLAMVVRNLTLAPVTRALAVGLSPMWSTFIGLPMDIMHSLWVARTWEADAKGVRPTTTFPFYETKEGRFRKVYSPFAGVDTLQIGLDMKRTFKDVYGRGPLTENLMKHGLVMNFLTQRQNRYMKGVKPPGDWAKMMDLLSYHGLSMELWARVATADRVIRRDAKKLGITYEQALKNDDIMYKAAHAGRDRMDYNQGGWFVKALDQSGMIFLNAAVLGTRTFWRQAIDNPVDFAFRTAQLGLTAAGVTAAAWSLYPETMKDMSEKGNRRDVTWPIAPNWLRVKDRDGDDISFHFKLRMDPNAAFLYRIFEGLTRTYMYDQGLIKEEPDYKELVKTLKHLGPVDIKLQPALQAWVDYTTNYSWWKERQMYTQLGGKTFDWPESQHEGMFDENVPQMARDIAEVTKLSPKRLAGTVTNVIPRNNEFVWLMGSAYEKAFSDVPGEVRKQHWLVTLAEVPGFNRVIGITRHGRGRWKVKSDIDNEIELEQMVRNSKFDMLATQNAWHGVKNKKELFKFMDEQDFDVHKDMVNTLKFIKDPMVKTLPHRDFWLSMRHMSIEGRAKTWIGLLDRASKSEKVQLLDELNQVMVIGGVVTPEFMEEVSKLRSP